MNKLVVPRFQVEPLFTHGLAILYTNNEYFADRWVANNCLSVRLNEYPDSDSEAGTYVACYPVSDENKVRATKFVEIIESLIEDEETLYEIIRNESNEINFEL